MKRVTIFVALLFLFTTQFSRGEGGAPTYTQAQGCPGPNEITSSEMVYQWPFENVGYNQYFSYVHPAVDLWARSYDPIHSAGYGFVSLVSFMPGGYGNYVVIDHGNGWQTLYAHMVEAPDVKMGDYVFPGKIIGYAGSTGHSTGPHLHFEVMKDGCYLNPRAVINGES